MLTPFPQWVTIRPTRRLLLTVYRLLSVSAVLTLWAMWPILRQLMDPEAFHAPRFSGLTATAPLVVVVGGVWLLGAVGLIVPKIRTVSALLLAGGVSGAMVLDLQVVGGHLVVIVGVSLALAAHLILESTVSLQRVSSAPLRVVRCLAPIIWLWAAIGKINPIFLSGAVLDASLRSGLLPVPDSLLSREFLRAVAIVTILLEVWIAGALVIPRFRKAGVLVAIGMHLGIIVTLARPQIFVAFGLTMAVTYLMLAGHWQESSASPPPSPPD